MSHCRGCGAELPPPKNRGNPRKWCSDTCRKRTTYGGTCVECGGRTSYGSPGEGNRPHERCARCANARHVATIREASAAYRKLVEDMWAEGMTAREIGEAVGWTSQFNAHISMLRRAGANLPHRRTPEQIARMASEGLEKARAIYRTQGAA